MSYSRTYETSVTGYETVELDYPASEGGGTVSDTVSVTIPISITIHVDTDPFDEEVESCENHLDALSGSVVATQTAQLETIARNARQISDRVTSGFFSLIRSEITQQAAEYRSATEALALKLSDMRAACLAKLGQMRQDYERITQRYARIFDDLDSEIEARIGALDGAAFAAHRDINAVSGRAIGGMLTTTATVGASESLGARSLVATGLVRHRTQQVLKAAHDFVMADRRLTQTTQRLLQPTGGAARTAVHLPVLFRRSEGPAGSRDDVFVATVAASPIAGATLANGFAAWFQAHDRTWRDASADEARQIDLYVRRLVGAMGTNGDAHSARVAATTLQLWNNNARPQAL